MYYSSQKEALTKELEEVLVKADLTEAFSRLGYETNKNSCSSAKSVSTTDPAPSRGKHSQ